MENFAKSKVILILLLKI